MTEKPVGPLPKIIIDLGIIRKNAREVLKKCAARGISAYPVIKALAGFAPAVGAVMAARPSGVLDSSFAGLRAASLSAAAGTPPRTGMIRLPAMSEIASLPGDQRVDYYFVSEISHIELLASRLKKFKAVVMVDTGDLREGVPLCDLDSFISKAAKKKGVTIAGVATNHACFSGIVPTVSNVEQFAEKAVFIEKKHGLSFELISGGNSSLLGLIADGRVHPAVNNVRVGEAIFLATDVITRNPIGWLGQGAFSVEAEVVEARSREASLRGVRTQNAFGETLPLASGRPRGGSARFQVLVNLGKRHFIVNGLKPLEDGLVIVGASSDYLIVDASGCGRKLKCGSRLRFGLDYPALMSAMQVAGTNVAVETV